MAILNRSLIIRYFGAESTLKWFIGPVDMKVKRSQCPLLVDIENNGSEAPPYQATYRIALPMI